jgi:hypothetical protein
MSHATLAGMHCPSLPGGSKKPKDIINSKYRGHFYPFLIPIKPLLPKS